MESASQAISKKTSSTVSVKPSNEDGFSDGFNAVIEKIKKGEFISPKLHRRYERETLFFVKKLFKEKPETPKKEAALAILQNMPSNIPSTSFSKLLEAGMKEWMTLKEQK